MPQPLSEADIIFPHLSNTPNLSSTLSSLRRSTLSIHNRLASIATDSAFISSVADAYDLPLVANERCGSWYIPLSLKSESVYFKSTDGHMGEWKFSLRRLNLQLLDVVENLGGAVIVDSTRRGKSMPDALSKTVPIWCCVINRAVLGGRHELFMPPQAVSESEHAQVEKKIDGFVQQFLDICKPNITHLRTKLQKPLRPIWVTQQSSLPSSPPSFPDFHLIVLCTASRRVRGAEGSENGYIQGAADDHEAWAQGLTPTLFWNNKDVLMKAKEEEAPGIIERLIAEKEEGHAVTTLIKPTSRLYISSSHNADLRGFDVVISCTPEQLPPTSLKAANVQHYLHLKCQTGKLGSRDLRSQLSRVLAFLTSFELSEHSKILICCPTGKDLSVGTMLALLCLYVNEDGVLDVSKRREARDIGKAFIKQRLSWITTSNPALNPSRATLQSVNAVLLESQDPKTHLHTADNSNKQPDLPPTSLAIREREPVSSDLEAPKVPEQQQLHDTSPSTPTILFHNLQTTSRPWTFTRTLVSTLPTHPSGTVNGIATFTPCTFSPPPNPTSSTSPSTNTTSPQTQALLYAEEGAFTTDTGLRFTARRKYVYLLKSREGEGNRGQERGKEDNGEGGLNGEGDQHIALHFFNDEKTSVTEGVGPHGEAIGGLFVEMGALQGDKRDDVVLEAKNREIHVCAEDLYAASWKFSGGMSKKGGSEGDGVGGGRGEMWWEVRYDVKGPKKEYVSETRYMRG
ncbi:Nn.00g067150.m01.CDS01 [Neocucurbitaria sp. VM-36]